jgi:sulfatase maturation enzyme AslB (radical SAM superfamily)
MYSTNLTVLKFKDTGITDFVSMWEKFRSVNLMISIDAIGELFDAIRSNASWTKVEQNLDTLLNQPSSNIRLTVTCVLSLLNIWELESFVDYFNQRHIQIQLILLQRPGHLALDTVPDSLKSQAIEIIQRVREQLPNLAATLDKAESLLINNTNQAQYEKFINSNSALDQLRGEQYMTFLPLTQGSK